MQNCVTECIVFSFDVNICVEVTNNKDTSEKEVHPSGAVALSESRISKTITTSKSAAKPDKGIGFTVNAFEQGDYQSAAVSVAWSAYTAGEMTGFSRAVDSVTKKLPQNWL